MSEMSISELSVLTGFTRETVAKRLQDVNFTTVGVARRFDSKLALPALNIKPAALWRQCQQRGWLKAGNATPTGNESSRTVKISGQAIRVLVFNRAEMLGE